MGMKGTKCVKDLLKPLNWTIHQKNHFLQYNLQYKVVLFEFQDVSVNHQTILYNVILAFRHCLNMLDDEICFTISSSKKYSCTLVHRVTGIILENSKQPQHSHQKIGQRRNEKSNFSSDFLLCENNFFYLVCGFFFFLMELST